MISRRRFAWLRAGPGSSVPRITQEKLEGLLGELVASIKIDEETGDWIKEALLESHSDEKEYHDSCVLGLNEEHQRIQNRLDQMYIDKLDGKIDEDFWKQRSEEWRSEQARILRSIHDRQQARATYFEEGVQIIGLAQRAYPLWLRQTPHERRRLLDILLSNCTFDGVSLYPTYRKPFCWLAKGLDRSVWCTLRDLNRIPG
jgi:site-specific DNA recombinase